MISHQHGGDSRECSEGASQDYWGELRDHEMLRLANAGKIGLEI